MQNKLNVIIIYNKIFHYRIPIWNLLAEKCNLTVTYSEGGKKSIPQNANFKIMYLPPYKETERFVIQRANIRKLISGYDVVIAYGDITWLKNSTLPWFNKKKIIFWTLGVSASYDSGYDEKSTWDRVRAFFYKQADALVFYTAHPIAKYTKMGIKPDKMFEAPNTVAVYPIKDILEKDSILFIGTLYKQKGIQYLLDAYKANIDNPNILPLNIIGDGPDAQFIKQWIEENHLGNVIRMIGAVYDNSQKAAYFARSYACISPLQAGLSVLESMGYGVPFITVKSAITGGELFNIHDGDNGITMDSPMELNNVVADIFNNRAKYVKMGERAREFYLNYRKPEDMADGLWKAIQYVMNQ